MNNQGKEQETPSPEVLKPQADADEAKVENAAAKTQKLHEHGKRTAYRPSHKSTFIGAGVVVGILALNVVVIGWLLRSNTAKTSEANRTAVTLSAETLNGLGVSRNPVSNEGAELTVGPDSKFNGKVTIADDVSIAGQLRLNSTFSAASASLTKLDAGDASVNQLNVNGDATASTLNLRKDFNVVGLTRLQGPVTVTSLLTVNNNLNVAGNLAVGGTLSARSFQASSLTSDTTLTIGGHIVTRGSAPGVSAGGALGSNGTVSISGNDAAGTVAVNVGVGAAGGMIAQVSFRNNYGNTPKVMVTAVGRAMDLYVNRSASGFSIYTNAALPPGGYAVDYIVMQ